MPSAKKVYKDSEKYRKIRNKERIKYYRKTAIHPKKPWTKEDDAKVLAHEITDTELSKRIKHSVEAIQIRRCRLKAMQNNKTNFK